MADLAGSKIQIMNGAGTNLFPRTRAQAIVTNTTDTAVFDTNDKLKLAYTNVIDSTHIAASAVTNDKIVTMDASKLTGTIAAARLPSYVDDVIEVQYLGSGALPTFASASHANKWMFSTSNNKMYSGSTTAWVQKDLN